MNTYIAFLRGINVSGQRKIPMSELRDLLFKLNLENVQTYIQSGNVVFQSSEKNLIKLESQIYMAIKNHFEFEVPVLVLEQKTLQRVFDNCPFLDDEKVNSYFTWLYTVPDKQLIKEVAKISYSNETFIITEACVYFYSAIGYGKAKSNNNFFERKLKVNATTRNYKTMVKLLALSVA